MRTDASTFDSPSSGRERVVVDESWIKILTKFGLGTLIAIYLVYQLTGEIRSNTAATNVAVTQHVADSQQLSQSITAALQVIANVQIQQCVNAATTKDKRDACFSAIDRVAWVRK